MGKKGRVKWLVLIGLLGGLAAAQANPGSAKPVSKPVDDEPEAEEETPGKAKSLDIPPRPAPGEGRKTARPSSVKYIYKKDNFLQSLKLTHLDKDRISFEVSIAGRCELTYTGTARNEQGDQGTEIDEDEDGNIYSVDEYIHEGKDSCVLKIRVDSDSEEMIRLIGLGCKRSCRLKEDVVMRRDK